MSRQPKETPARCRRCGEPLQNGVCPKCGYKEYVPLDSKKIFWIRFILGAVMVVGLIVFLLIKNN